MRSHPLDTLRSLLASLAELSAARAQVEQDTTDEYERTVLAAAAQRDRVSASAAAQRDQVSANLAASYKAWVDAAVERTVQEEEDVRNLAHAVVKGRAASHRRLLPAAIVREFERLLSCAQAERERVLALPLFATRDFLRIALQVETLALVFSAIPVVLVWLNRGAAQHVAVSLYAVVLAAFCVTALWFWRVAKRIRWEEVTSRLTVAGIVRNAYELRDQMIVNASEECSRNLQAAQRARDRGLAEARVTFDRAVAEAQAAFDHALANAMAARDAKFHAIAEHWHQRLRAVKEAMSQLTFNCRPPFEEVLQNRLRGARSEADTSIPKTVPFGEFTVDLARVPNGVSTNRIFHVPTPLMTAPAMIPFPERPSLLLKAEGVSKPQAIRCLQVVMLRLLTSLPPGKVLFTIIDPIGLGGNFATFMHLADHQEKLVSSKIWTEERHITEQLEKLTEHVGVVVQKYLRGKYQTLDEYNAQAGELAEPYRFLVVADFPTRFTTRTAERLLSLASVGPRCGVYVLVMVDTAVKTPREVNLDDLDRHCNRVTWQDLRFKWHHAHFGRWPLSLDEPPSSDVFISLLNQVGAEASRTSRVEVPFESLFAPRETWWAKDSRCGLSIPLGKSGATAWQNLELGKNTAQHVLIAGKVGSGKSNLLHVLITRGALTYSPDELELYLIDFKKGVEFKPYALHELPHARAIAIESEREFGLSILQRLDQEITARGELFRAHNVNHISEYRDRAGDKPMPRILLVVDEFHEFFSQHDQLSHQAELYFDRLVRQGRAFGVHAILASQTLAGRHRLPRATMDQMAVRIALQCSDADSREILEKDNGAARFLARPGEAIYNDVNGREEGNNPFQVAWLSDTEREKCLSELRWLAGQRGVARTPPIVFEGNEPAGIAQNRELMRELSEKTEPHAATPWRAWLGEPAAIRPLTCAVFELRGGSNLAIVGPSEASALGIVFTSAVSLAAPLRREEEKPCFVILDGSNERDREQSLHELRDLLGAEAERFDHRKQTEAVARVVREVNRRLNENSSARRIFFVIHGLQFLRQLRRTEDSRALSAPSPSKDLEIILSEGPSLGVHSIFWCDTATGFERVLGRNPLRFFDMRVFMQMSAGDSQTLMGSSLAARLRPHLAYFVSEDTGHVEKFRPYGLPTADWKEHVASCLRSRA